MQTICFKLPTIDQVEIRITALGEYQDPAEHITQIDDDPEAIGLFLKAVEENKAVSAFGWCTVQVTAVYKGHYGYDQLAACSYRDEEAFKLGDYYEQMKAEAFENLITDLKDLAD